MTTIEETIRLGGSLGMTVGERIRAARIMANMSQKELADKIGNTSHSIIWQYEQDERHPKLEKLVKIASALGVPVSALTDMGNPQQIESFTIWKDNWPIGEIRLYPWQADMANHQNTGIYFALKKQEEE